MTGSGTCAAAADEVGKTPTGIIGMTGNVWEWTSTASRPLPGDPLKYVDRGGAWSNDNPEEIATTFRATNLPTRRGSNIGFRCAR
jgi:formylglycine-generating enzyme required for sulfatase activity